MNVDSLGFVNSNLNFELEKKSIFHHVLAPLILQSRYRAGRGRDHGSEEEEEDEECSTPR